MCILVDAPCFNDMLSNTKQIKAKADASANEATYYALLLHHPGKERFMLLSQTFALP